MIGALSQKQGQFRYGRYIGIVPSNNVANAPFFTYEQMSDKDRRYNHIIQNLITTETSIVIRTNYNYNWQNQAKVLLQDGKFYIINNITEQEEEINPQVYSLVRQSSDKLYYMELVSMDNYG